MIPSSEILFDRPLCLRHPQALHSTALLYILAYSEAFGNCDVPFQSSQMEENSEK